MRFGILSPGLTLLPRSHARWEEDGGVEHLVEIARAADRLGYEFMTCSEHVAIPKDVAAVRGGRYWDPLATFGYLAAHTLRIRFATYVLVLAYHHPLEIAKRYGTLDRVSGGRLILGVGVGSLREEFELLGAAFDDRGARADDAMRALRASFGRRLPEYHGEFYDFDDFLVDPCGVQQRVPIWVGGRTARSLRRAVELGDGWVPFGLTTDEQRDMLAHAQDTDAWQRRMRDASLPPFEIVMVPGRRLDPLGAPDKARALLDAIEAAGATMANITFRHDSPQHCAEQIEALAALAVRAA
jgi:probable F420-dependent oxidoreductase